MLDFKLFWTISFSTMSYSYHIYCVLYVKTVFCSLRKYDSQFTELPDYSLFISGKYCNRIKKKKNQEVTV